MSNYECLYYSISRECFQSSPCSHYVKDNRTGKFSFMDGRKIYLLISNCYLRCDHFDKYKTYKPSFIKNLTWNQLDSSLIDIKDEDLNKHALIISTNM